MEDVPAVWMRLRIGVAAVGVIVGLSVFTVFGVHYNNWNAAGWGLMSGVIALITLTVHIYSTRGLSQKDERKLKTLMLMGCFFQLMGVCGFTVYLTLAIVSNQGNTPTILANVSGLAEASLTRLVYDYDT
ncbi:heme transporter hrg1-A-like [Argopecten irradians]|uniref:heme transporter hrg1-A-like n=1 Tax=Argopecten irradians TaxID=31199 RepID=UPI003721EA5F